MKLIIAVLCASVALFGEAGQQTSKKKTEKKAAATVPAKPAATVQQIQIPAGAVKGEDGNYRYTDAQGKKWLYYQTPFGVGRAEDKPLPERPKTQDEYAAVKAVEDGDTIHFERPSPFGVYKWDRKKSELDKMETEVWTRERAKAAGKSDKQD
jgi:hypothetical protein